jgi:hypothetical protein
VLNKFTIYQGSEGTLIYNRFLLIKIIMEDLCHFLIGSKRNAG